MSILAGQDQTSPRQLVENGLAAFFESERARAVQYGQDLERLWRIAGQRAVGGKLVRPLLLLESFDALEPNAETRLRDVAVNLAVAVELLHYSFLVHDDVIDGDLLRRGRPNLIGALLQEISAADVTDPALRPSNSTQPETRELHWARSGGILMGDLLLSAAHQRFARAEVPDRQRLRLLDLLDHTTYETVAGEFVDVGMADHVTPPSISNILTMTRNKTATYTFELPLRAAAILAGTSSPTQDVLGQIGHHLGLAFQLQDDLLSTFGDASNHGKDRFSDLREGKETAIIAYARRSKSWPEMETLFGTKDMSDAQAAELAELLTASGARQFVEDLVDDQLENARSLITGAQPALPREVALVIVELVLELRDRRS